jgi:hypothetical protein
MAEEELLPGRSYWLKLGTQMVTATIHTPKYQVDVNTMERLAAKTLGLNRGFELVGDLRWVGRGGQHVAAADRDLVREQSDRLAGEGRVSRAKRETLFRHQGSAPDVAIDH